jgi:hypothetical protein
MTFAFHSVKSTRWPRWVRCKSPPATEQSPRELPDPDAPPQTLQPDDVCSTVLLLRRLGLSSTETADL